MTTGTGVISGVSVSHQRAAVDDIDAACAESQRAAVESLLAERGVREALVLQTCNRAEAYVVTDEAAAGEAALETYLTGVPEGVVRSLGHEESLRHLMRVAAGLESLVLGEDQILGQLRDAYEDARGVGGIDTTLEDGVTKALHVGERARTETNINEGATSLGSAAVRLARGECDLTDATGLVVGAGEMATLAAKSLSQAVDRLLVANRTVPHAEHVAEAVDVEASAVGLNALDAAVSEADVVISATGSADPVLDDAVLAAAGETFVVDIAQPRDVAATAADHPHVTHRDLDELEDVTAETRAARAAAAEEVETMIDEEFDHLLTQYKRKRADSVIATMYESAEHVKRREVNRALAELDDVSDEEREVIESMADSLVGQLLAAPTKSLRDAAEADDWTTINTALQLFDPEFGTRGPPALTEGMNPEDIPEGMRSEMPADVLEQLDD